MLRNSWSYGITSLWELNDTKFLTKEPMFGKCLPLNNDTSRSSEKVLCLQEMSLYLGCMDHGHRMMQYYKIG
jgi:hypothetical protein